MAVSARPRRHAQLQHPYWRERPAAMEVGCPAWAPRATPRPTAISMPAIAPPAPIVAAALISDSDSRLDFLSFFCARSCCVAGACGRPASRVEVCLKIAGAPSHQTAMRSPHHHHSKSLRPRMHARWQTEVIGLIKHVQPARRNYFELRRGLT
jgi:hypothetical protein